MTEVEPRFKTPKATAKRSRSARPAMCVCLTDACTGRATESHHRRRRSQGGDDGPANLLRLCRSCHHDVIHANPDWANRHGFILRTGAPDFVHYGCQVTCPVDHDPTSRQTIP